MSKNKFELTFSSIADAQLDELEKSPDKKTVCKAVHKALGYMETNLRHHSLSTHEYSKERGKRGEKVFESYAQNKTPGAFRIFWHYGPGEGVISVLSIVPHP
jgi:hypothetical protein